MKAGHRRAPDANKPFLEPMLASSKPKPASTLIDSALYGTIIVPLLGSSFLCMSRLPGGPHFILHEVLIFYASLPKELQRSCHCVLPARQLVPIRLPSTPLALRRILIPSVIPSAPTIKISY